MEQRYLTVIGLLICATVLFGANHRGLITDAFMTRLTNVTTVVSLVLAVLLLLLPAPAPGVRAEPQLSPVPDESSAGMMQAVAQTPLPVEVTSATSALALPPLAEQSRSTIALSPTVKPTPEPLPSPEISTLQIIDGPANIRSGAGTVYPVIGQANQGAILPIMGKDSRAGWWQITFQGQTGWILGELVSVLNADGVPEAGSPPVPTATFTPLPLPTDTPLPTATPTPIVTATATPTIPAPPPVVVTPSQPDDPGSDRGTPVENCLLRVSGFSRDLKAEPGGGLTIGSLADGEYVAQRRSGDWFYIERDGQSGWVNGIWATVSPGCVGGINASAGNAITSCTLQVAGFSRDLKAEPNSGFTIGSLQDGKYPAVRRSGDWFYIESGNQSGWVNGSWAVVDHACVGGIASSAGEAITSCTLRVSGFSRDLKTEPNGSFTIGTLQDGEYPAGRRSGDWFYIESDSQSGWVNGAWAIVSPACVK